MALPFFRNTFTSTIFYSTAFFGAYELAVRLAKIKQDNAMQAKKQHHKIRRRTINLIFD
jgi:hypothetical protein